MCLINKTNYFYYLHKTRYFSSQQSYYFITLHLKQIKYKNTREHSSSITKGTDVGTIEAAGY